MTGANHSIKWASSSNTFDCLTARLREERAEGGHVDQDVCIPGWDLAASEHEFCSRQNRLVHRELKGTKINNRFVLRRFWLRLIIDVMRTVHHEV